MCPTTALLPLEFVTSIPPLAVGRTSNAFGDISLRTLATEYAESVEAELGPAHVDLIGASFGGLLAHLIGLELYAIGGSPRRLIMIDPNPPPPPGSGPMFNASLQQAAGLLLQQMCAPAVDTTTHQTPHTTLHTLHTAHTTHHTPHTTPHIVSTRRGTLDGMNRDDLMRESTAPVCSK